MKLLVYGAGAVGSYVGAMLSRQGHEITLLTRPETAAFLAERGLRVSGPEMDNVLVEPELVTGVRRAFEEGRTYDAILLAMKAYDVEESLNPVIAFAPRPYPIIITLQNGIGIEEKVQEALEGATVIAGSLTTPLSRESPDHVRVERADRGLGLAPTRAGQKIQRWVDSFNEAGITTDSFRDYREMKWSKALLNMVGNATSAIVNRHPRMIYEAAPTYQLEMDMLGEALRVMKKLRLDVVDLPGAPAKRLALAVGKLPGFLAKPVLTRVVAEGRGNKMPSFHIDLMAGRNKNEVLYHNGAVAAAGRDLDLPVPVNTALTTILLKMARGEIEWDVYNGNPTQLVHDIEAYRQRSRKKK